MPCPTRLVLRAEYRELLVQPLHLLLAPLKQLGALLCRRLLACDTELTHHRRPLEIANLAAGHNRRLLRLAPHLRHLELDCTQRRSRQVAPTLALVLRLERSLELGTQHHQLGEVVILSRLKRLERRHRLAPRTNGLSELRHVLLARRLQQREGTLRLKQLQLALVLPRACVRGVAS
eukprot:scaffold88481_cov34-Phaeocystis_antarctica.AAC.3